MTDFGSEESFEKAVERMKEHHDVDINAGAVRKVTEYHAERSEAFMLEVKEPLQEPKAMIMEMDGEMLPLVEHQEGEDLRRGKKVLWAELRLGAVQNKNEVDWKYACSFKSSKDLGDRMETLLKRMKFGDNTKVQGIGDGAKWIYEEGERIVGPNFRYLIDLYHLSEYLMGATKGWAENPKEEMERLKSTCVEEGIEKVLEE